MKRNIWLVLIWLIAGAQFAIAQVDYPGNKPGSAMAKNTGSHLVFENNVIQMDFGTAGNKLFLAGVRDKQTHENLTLNKAALFTLLLADNRTITSEDFTLASLPTLSIINAASDSVNYADRQAGKMYAADLENAKLGLKVHWEASLRDGSNYVRQVFTFTAADSVKISKITLIELPASTGVKRAGIVDGSPLVHHNLFFSLEHPMSQISTDKNHYSCISSAFNGGGPEKSFNHFFGMGRKPRRADAPRFFILH